jgi:hypothetical protein
MVGRKCKKFETKMIIEKIMTNDTYYTAILLSYVCWELGWVNTQALTCVRNWVGRIGPLLKTGKVKIYLNYIS